MDGDDPTATTPDQLRQLVSGNGDRQAVMAKAATLVTDCVASAPDDIGPTSQLFEALWGNDLADVMAVPERRRLLQRLLRDLFSSVHIGPLVEVDAGFFRHVLTRLTEVGPLMDPGDPTEPERYELAGILIDTLFTTKLDSLVAEDRIDFVAFLLKTASRMLTLPELAVLKKPAPATFVTAKLSVLGTYAPHVAAAMVDAHWGSWPGELGRHLIVWIFDTVSRDQLNAPGKGRAARGLNLLWTADEYGLICKLILDGVDCTVQAKAWGGPKREGVYSGYVQPLTHVLGKYVKSVSLLGTRPPPKLADPVKVEGASKVIQAIRRSGKQPKLLLDYPTIRSTELVTSFQSGPGMIWGFEDVRLPYILAARGTRFGQRPLRMLDMWPAIGELVDDVNYAALVAVPNRKIPTVVEAAVKRIQDEIRAGAQRYDGVVDEPTFLDQFRGMCTSFLHYFANRSPYGAFRAQPGVSGKDSEKRLSTYACTIGLHWSAELSLPVYYCLDGLEMNDVVNYKSYKIEEIDAFLSALATPATQLLHHGPFTDVITLAEMREILRSWDKFKGVVRFVEQGQVMTAQASDEWVRKWQPQLAASEQGKQRKSLPNISFQTEVIALKDDPDFWASIGFDVRWKCVREQNAIRLAGDNPERIDLLVKVLAEDCPTLRTHALVPNEFVQALQAAHQAQTVPLVSKVWAALAYVCPGLRSFLEPTIRWRFGPPPATPQSPSPPPSAMSPNDT